MLLIAFLSLSINSLFALDIPADIEDIFTVSTEPRARLLDDAIDASLFEINLLKPSTKNIGLRSLVFIDNRPILQDPLNLSKSTFLFSKREVLNDIEKRVGDDFQIPDNLYNRVSFWYDIYTQYDSNHIVFHDSDSPWIIYKVVDITPVLSQPKKHKWTKYHESQKLIVTTRKHISKILISLSKKKNYKALNTEEYEIFKKFSGLRNPRASIKGAAKRLRSQTGQKNYFQAGLVRSTEHLPKMEQIFISYGLPPELTRIPLVESSFDVSAYSKVGASGVWQIMPYIAKQFGILNKKHDGRSDIISSTRVAAKLLKEKHSILKEWPLSITAYNHGPGGIKKAVKLVKSSDLGKILEKYNSKRFGFASQNFYACFLASLFAERYQDSIFTNLDPVLVGSIVPSETSKN
ncbi:MAG: lytic transglycosylase domain-containing protein [Bdellovibrionales bacterium]|nr:lytic transglycosylase domain-containing protein [Bdellovibrionales bacterium]